MFTKSFLVLLASAAALTAAAPTGTQTAPPRTTHTVVAGRPGLRFDPENIVADVGSIVEFHFLPANHSVVESSFDSPCVPKDDTSFFSGFFPVSKNPDGSVAQSGEVFQIEVKDDKPIWFYCGQTKGAHCQSGMVGAINQNFNSAKTLAAFRTAASKVQGPAAVQPAVQGGLREQNPNPLGGF